jgi:hypothetical protein
MASAAERARTALAIDRQQAQAFAEQVGDKRLRALLEDAAKDLRARLAVVEASKLGPESYTAMQMRATLKQVEQVVARLTKGMRGLLVDNAEQAGAKGAEGAVKYLQQADKAFRGIGTQPLALRTASMIDAARGASAASILRRLSADPNHPGHMGVLQRYGVNTIGHFERELQKGIVQRKSWQQMRKDITEKSPFLQAAPKFWATRIVRTEFMAAQSKGQHEAVVKANKDLGGFVKILSAVFDDRTGADSVAIHGMIRRPEEPFEWWEGAFMHPPNRPNDREIVVPHRIAWPIPPYLAWKDDAAVAKAWERDGRKGAPPERPVMTTVPLGRFGKG